MTQEKSISLSELKKLQEDDELDLSTRQLVKVPKGIGELTRLRIVDLSRNQISVLPDEICKISTLVKLDLSGNQLHHLPHDIGKLTRLEHLDLLSNNLEDLPLTFANLKSLKYLDLKRNPLDERLQKAAGKCSNNKECKDAAKAVVQYMAERKSDLENLKKKEEALNQKLRQEIAAREAEAQKATKKKENAKQQSAGTHTHEPRKAEPKRQEKQQKRQERQNTASSTSANNSSPWFITRVYRLTFSLVYYVLLGALLASTTGILLDCANGGTKIAGNRPLCADLTRMTKFEKPSDAFLNNVRASYSKVLNGYVTKVDYFTAGWRRQAAAKYATFKKTDAGKTFEKYFFKVHAFVTEKVLIISRFAQKQWKAVNTWYQKEGHKTFGQVVDNVKAVALIVYDVTVEVATLAANGAKILVEKIVRFYHAWIEGGFNHALNTLSH